MNSKNPVFYRCFILDNAGAWIQVDTAKSELEAMVLGLAMVKLRIDPNERAYFLDTLRTHGLVKLQNTETLDQSKIVGVSY